jgi:ribosomal protein S18 acetylase RimI-like enzyme
MTTSTTNAEIRIVGEENADWFEDVAPGTFDDDVVRDRLMEVLRDPRHHLIAARVDGAIVGFISALHYVHPDKPRPEVWINEVGVAPAFQRRGLAKSMLDALLGHARALGCAEAWVLTDRANAAAMALYAACGGDAPTDHVMIEFRLDDGRTSLHQAHR